VTAADTSEGLLDTSVVIHFERVRDPSHLPAVPAISAITLAELSVGPLTAATPGEAAVRQMRLQEAETTYDPIPFDAFAARVFGVVSAGLRQSGRTTTSRRFDALIAATAIAYGLPLYTMNPDDFAGIEGLDVRAVPHPDHDAP